MKRYFIVLLLSLLAFGASAKIKQSTLNAADRGDADAQCEVGMYYHNAEDYAKAVYWFEKSAKAGNAKAIYNLGYCYEYGQGVGEDKVKAAFKYREAAELGVPEAQYMLAGCYKDGIGMAKNAEQAKKWYKLAADQGYPKAQYEYAVLYLDKTSDSYCRMLNAAYKNLEADAKAKAAYALGVYYIEVPGQDEMRGLALLDSAADGGNKDAMLYLANLYREGKVVAKNQAKATELLSKIDSAEIYTNNGILYVVNGVPFEMVRVDGGTYQMGSWSGFSFEQPVHSETVGTFYIGRTEVTQRLWAAVMGNNPSQFRGENNPVENVSWNDCQEFVERLSRMTGRTFRLPTEVEWEYAARGGNRSRGCLYSGSENLSSVGWYDGNSGSMTHPVGQKLDNELGLFDMSGNVWEWCQDCWRSNSNASFDCSYRVFRGGSWSNTASYCRVALRLNNSPGYRSRGNGMRLAL